MTWTLKAGKNPRCQEHNNVRVLVHAVPLHVPTMTTPAYQIAEPRRQQLNRAIRIPLNWDNETRKLRIGYITMLSVVDNMVIGHGSIEPGSWSQVAVARIRDRKVKIQPILIHNAPKLKRGLGWYVDDWTLDSVVLSGQPTTLWPEGSTSIRLGM